jgi:hypothetical protein
MDMSLTPNMTDESFARASSGVALSYKMFALDQYSAVVDREFKEGYLRIWEIITNRLKNLNTNNDKFDLTLRDMYDFRNIDVSFDRNLPVDREKNIQTAIKLMESKLISQSAAIVESGLDVDPDSEIMKIKEEKISPKSVGDLREMVMADMIDTYDALVLAFGEEKAKEYYGRKQAEQLGMDERGGILMEGTQKKPEVGLNGQSYQRTPAGTR